MPENPVPGKSFTQDSGLHIRQTRLASDYTFHLVGGLTIHFQEGRADGSWAGKTITWKTGCQ